MDTVSLRPAVLGISSALLIGGCGETPIKSAEFKVSGHHKYEPARRQLLNEGSQKVVAKVIKEDKKVTVLLQCKDNKLDASEMITDTIKTANSTHTYSQTVAGIDYHPELVSCQNSALKVPKGYLSRLSAWATELAKEPGISQ